MEIAAMSPPVSPQRRRDRGSGPTDRGGFSLTATKRLFSMVESSKVCEAAMLILFPTPPALRATSPIRAPRGRGGHYYASATLSQKTHAYPQTHRGGHCYVSTFNSAQPHICQLHSSLDSQLSTLNPQLSTIDP